MFIKQVEDKIYYSVVYQPRGIPDISNALQNVIYHLVNSNSIRLYENLDMAKEVCQRTSDGDGLAKIVLWDFTHGFARIKMLDDHPNYWGITLDYKIRNFISITP
jgi:hypothetical protein